MNCAYCFEFTSQPIFRLTVDLRSKDIPVHHHMVCVQKSAFQWLNLDVMELLDKRLQRLLEFG
jgi:hypothetical protein